VRVVKSVMLVISVMSVLACQGLALDARLTGADIVSKVENLSEAADRTSDMKMVLIDSRGKESRREIKFWTKGKRMRLIKFLSPADVKGVGFLVLDSDLPSEKMYLYLPAFSKVRRIAGSQKSGSFMGTDFSYNDIGSSLYAQDYEAARLADEGGNYVLDLKKKAGSQKDYAKLKMWADQNFVIAKVEFYEKETNSAPQKILTAEKVEKVGQYWIPKKLTMQDLRKEHKTVLEMDNVQFDAGLSDSLFTERNLQR
jgi:outer membrane lipoprotein-sorting protein